MEIVLGSFRLLRLATSEDARLRAAAQQAARAERVEAQRRLEDVLAQRRVRLGIALAWPLDLLRRRRP